MECNNVAALAMPADSTDHALPLSLYEVDYLITPELGGADDIKNLWPQPFTAKNWSAYTKDDLEDRLHELVCSGNWTFLPRNMRSRLIGSARTKNTFSAVTQVSGDR